jgi:hypothetical protein
MRPAYGSGLPPFDASMGKGGEQGGTAGWKGAGTDLSGFSAEPLSDALVVQPIPKQAPDGMASRARSTAAPWPASRHAQPHGCGTGASARQWGDGDAETKEMDDAGPADVVVGTEDVGADPKVDGVRDDTDERHCRQLRQGYLPSLRRSSLVQARQGRRRERGAASRCGHERTRGALHGGKPCQEAFP